MELLYGVFIALLVVGILTIRVLVGKSSGGVRSGACPGCDTGSVVWHHAKVDGGRDLRYKDNFQECDTCNWKSWDTKSSKRLATPKQTNWLPSNPPDEVAEQIFKAYGGDIPIAVIWVSSSGATKGDVWGSIKIRAKDEGIPTSHWRKQHTENYWIYAQRTRCKWVDCPIC